MNAQTPKLIDLILCDEIRREDNGKLLVIGMYLGAILVPRFPFRMPSLAFFCKWKTLGLLPTGEFRLTSPSKKVLGGFGMGSDGDPQPEAQIFYMTFVLQNIQLSEAGTHTLSYKPTGGKRYRPIFSFEVNLRNEDAARPG